MKIRMELDIVFDNHEAWDNVDDFSSSFVKFLTAENLKAEKITGGKENVNKFSLFVYREPLMPAVSETKTTTKQDLAKLYPKGKK